MTGLCHCVAKNGAKSPTKNTSKLKVRPRLLKTFQKCHPTLQLVRNEHCVSFGRQLMLLLASLEY